MPDIAPVYGVIGGSGLRRIPSLEIVDFHSRVDCDGPFGMPSSGVAEGTVHGHKVFFLQRHGPGHHLTPSEVPYRANIYTLKKLGVTRLLGVSAVGSLQENIEPGHLVIPDQLFDRTQGIRQSTFFGDGIVAHAPFGDPYCPELNHEVYSAAMDVSGVTVHGGGTLVCMEGPAFSTKAEARFYRHLGFKLIGMTSLTEAKLAREAELCYTTLALVTDFDCWYEGHDGVTSDAVVAQMESNADMAIAVLTRLFELFGSDVECNCAQSMDGAIAIDPTTLMSYARSQFRKAHSRLQVICGQHLPKLEDGDE